MTRFFHKWLQKVLSDNSTLSWSKILKNAFCDSSESRLCPLIRFNTYLNQVNLFAIICSPPTINAVRGKYFFEEVNIWFKYISLLEKNSILGPNGSGMASNSGALLIKSLTILILCNFRSTSQPALFIAWKSSFAIFFKIFTCVYLYCLLRVSSVEPFRRTFIQPIPASMKAAASLTRSHATSASCAASKSASPLAWPWTVSYIHVATSRNKRPITSTLLYIIHKNRGVINWS